MSTTVHCSETLRNTHSKNEKNTYIITDITGAWKVLVLYRYISWLLTSAFYLVGTENFLITYKLAVIISLLVYSNIIIYLYEHSKEKVFDKIKVVTIETLGIALFLIPTGGLESHFMWYALNPIFMAAILLPGAHCWGVLLFFLASASTGSIFLKEIEMIDVWRQNNWLLLVFLLLTTFASLFAKLIRQLSKAYDELSVSYSASEKLHQHNANLYQALESFSSSKETTHLADLLASYARKLTGSQATVCYLSQANMESSWIVSDPDCIFTSLANKQYWNDIWNHLNEKQQQNYRQPFKCIDGKDCYLICVPLQSMGNRFGFLGYVISNKNKNDDWKKTIGFLAELGASALERRKTDELSTRLLVSEEQNRIANEIHDGVSQYLFSIVYALHGLSRREGSLQDREVQNQLALVSNTANKAARELRASIYKISPRRRGEQVFVTGISSYLEGLANLNKISVDLQAEGSEETLSPALQKALYRIVRESTSNAIRHGKCSTIKVNLQMEPSKVMLEVVDDGQGFGNENPTNKGLGLENMRSLMASFKGRFSIDSSHNQGTKVTCIVPDN